MDAEPKKKIAILGQPVKASGDNRVYIIKQLAQVGLMYKMICPECTFSAIKKVTRDGSNRWDCPQCKATVGFKAVSVSSTSVSSKSLEEKSNDKDKNEKKESNQEGNNIGQKKYEEQKKSSESENVTEHKKPTKRLDKSANQNLGKLVWGRILARKHYLLHSGSIYIGRQDNAEPSDLSLTDKYVSRKSVKLDVIPGDKGYLFKMTVEHASNPVFVNSTEIAINNSIYLNYEDVITLGKTKLVFKKV